jgi:hypothetical protein
MPVADDDMIIATKGFYVSENRLNPKATPDEIAAFVRKGGHTGQLQYQTNDGGVLGVLFIEKKNLTDEEDDDIRTVLGMETGEEEDEDE